ncbi:MAG TPA: hydroxymethylbilane synthase, partial [Candidatus Bathyarchaeia archaeon]|nr:hydroxymethylbilane synthase [Candidatus Bathyarchaeia archaeon]
LSRRVDVGVHSLKDMPTVLPAGLLLAAFPRREDPRDVLVSRSGAGWDALPAGAVIGTSSPRRCALVLARRPDLDAQPIRGNVETRLEKLRAGGYEALVLAAAGLARLQIDPPGTIFLDPEEFVPAAGQGLLAVEARETDREVLELLSRLDDTRGRSEALAERAVLARLGADCHTPVAAHGRLAERQLRVTALVASIDGRTVLRAALAGPAADSIALGTAVADDLLAKGAKALLDASRK